MEFGLVKLKVDIMLFFNNLKFSYVSEDDSVIELKALAMDEIQESGSIGHKLCLHLLAGKKAYWLFIAHLNAGNNKLYSCEHFYLPENLCLP